jgi:hypothetical protein
MDDEPQVEQLENRIDTLEATIEKMMPSRRDAMKMGGAALVGGAAMSGTASAGTNQVGTIGSASQPVDLESEDINNTDTVTTDTLDSTTVDNSGTVTTQDISIQQNVNGADTSTAVNGEALTSDGSGGLAFASVGGGVPPNFSYVDEKSNRSFNTTFTNNTGKALYVLVQSFDNSGGSINTSLEVNGKRISNGRVDGAGTFTNVTLNGFVPNGGTYAVNSFDDGSLSRWFEAEM